MPAKPVLEHYTDGNMVAGETFGELALFDRRSRSASARAMGATELRIISSDDLSRMVCDPLLRSLLATLSRRLRTIDDAFERLMMREAPEREQLAALWESKVLARLIAGHGGAEAAYRRYASSPSMPMRRAASRGACPSKSLLKYT
jgi:CRP-like cAMP-binding protein